MGTGELGDRSDLLLSLASRVTATLDLQVVLDESLKALRQLFEFGGGAIQLIDGGALVAAATDPPISDEARTVRIPVGKGVSGTIAATGEPVYIPDITVDERVFPQGRKKGISTGVRSYLGVPLIMSGGPIGVVQVDHAEVDAFDAQTRALFMAFVPTIAAAVQNAQLFDRERQALANLEATQHLKDGFLSVVSHELRTPLTAIRGFATTISDHIDDLSPRQLIDLAERISSNGERLTEIVERLLYAAEIEKDLVEEGHAPTDIEAAAREAFDAEPSARISLEVEGEGSLVDAHPKWLRRVIHQLTENALKYSPDDSPVVVRISRDRDHIRLAVRDYGRGIPKDVTDLVFQPFLQLEEWRTRTVGGLGLGLFVVRRLCDAMGAAIEIASHSDGTEVVVAFPALTDTEMVSAD